MIQASLPHSVSASIRNILGGRDVSYTKPVPGSVQNVSGMDFIEILFWWSFPASFCSVRASAVGELNQGTVNHLRSSEVAEIRLLFKMLTDQ